MKKKCDECESKSRSLLDGGEMVLNVDSREHTPL